MKNKQVVIIGGGKVAERKLSKLLNTGAIITVISPIITERIQAWVVDGKVMWENKYFHQDDVKAAFLVIASTNNRDVNRKVFEACHPNQLINIVDDPENSTFIFPSTFNRGKLSFSVSTSGASPGLSKKIIHQLESLYNDGYEDYVDFLFEARKLIKSKVLSSEERKDLLSQLLNEEFLHLTKEKQYEKREKMLQELLEKRRDC